MSRITIRSCDVIDGMGNPPRRGIDVLVEGNRIASVRPRRQRNGVGGFDGTLIDGKGKTVMPGLIDAHCHMTYGESMTQEEQDIFTSVEGRTLRAAWNVQKVLAAGVTGISQPGGSYFIGVAVRDGISEGSVKGPRMTSAGRYITTSNGLTDWYPDDTGAVEGNIGIRCNTLDEMIAEVRRQVKNGVDFIKLADSPFGEYQSFRDEELVAIADLAHQLNKRCTIHARGDAEIARRRAGRLRLGHARQHHDPGHRRAPGREARPRSCRRCCCSRPGPSTGRPTGAPTDRRRHASACSSARTTAFTWPRRPGSSSCSAPTTGFAMTPYGEWHAKELELLMKYAGRLGARGHPRRDLRRGRRAEPRGRGRRRRAGHARRPARRRRRPERGHHRAAGQTRIETIILDGEIVEIDRDLESWPNEQSLTYAHAQPHAGARPHGRSPPLAHGGAGDPDRWQPDRGVDGEAVPTDMQAAGDGRAQGRYRPRARNRRRRARHGR